MLKNSPEKIARTILEIGAVRFQPQNPVTFKSGLLSPIYVDNRQFPFHPEKWKIIIESFAEVIQNLPQKPDIIAGMESAGIPHSAALGYTLSLPSVFVRKEAKGYGMKKRIEGGEVAGKKVLLVEDVVSTGGSSLSGIRALQDENAIVTDCLVIVSYDLPDALEKFSQSKIILHRLTTFPIIIEEAYKLKIINREDYATIQEWFKDPHKWAEKYGRKN